MSDNNPTVSEFPKCKKTIDGVDVHKTLTSIGDSLFGAIYFDVEAPCELNPSPVGMQSQLTGKLLTWADSSFDGVRAKAVKDVIKGIINETFSTNRLAFRKEASELLAEK